MFITNRFDKGLVSDITYSLPQGDTYYDALDLRLYSKSGLTEGSLMTFPGTAPVANLPDRNTEIIGSIPVKDAVVLFAVNIADGTSSIFKLDKSGYLDTLYTDLHSTSKLSFSVDHRIHGASRRDNEFSEKVYWTDGINTVRHMNIYEDVSAKEATYFNLNPEYVPCQIDITKSSSGGDLDPGMVQYFVRYFNKYNSQTSVAGWSNEIYLTKYTDSGPFSLKGTDSEESSNSSVIVEVNGIDQSFTHTEVYRIHYTAINTQPAIRLIGRFENLFPTMSIIDNGMNDIDEMTVEEFNAMVVSDMTIETLEAHKGILMFGNIETSLFDIDVDCRAYSFANDGTTGQSVLHHTSDSMYGNLTINSDLTWTIENGPSGGDLASIPQDHDCINPSTDMYAMVNNWASGQSSIQMWKDSGATVHGGLGPVVSYEVKVGIERYISDDGVPVTGNNEGVEKINYKTHKRGEVYRYGMVFYNKYGAKSNVKWIADIIIPYELSNGSSSDNPFATIETDGKVEIHTAEVEFKIDFSSIPADISEQFEYCQIVRVPRSRTDITAVTGVITKTVSFPDGMQFGGYNLWNYQPDVVYPIANMYESTLFTSPINEYTYPVFDDYQTCDEFVVFNSPDVSVNDFKVAGGNAKLLNIGYSQLDSSPYEHKWNYGSNTSTIITYNPHMPSSGYTNLKKFSTCDIKESAIIGATVGAGNVVMDQRQVSSNLTLMGTTSRFYLHNNDPEDPIGVVHGETAKSLLLNVENMDATNNILDYNYTVTSDIVVDNYAVRYGGNNIKSRNNNVYTPASEFILNNGLDATVDINGDSMISNHEQLLAAPHPLDPYYLLDDIDSDDEDVDNYWDEVVLVGTVFMFPVDSTVNCNLMSMHPYEGVLSFGDRPLNTEDKREYDEIVDMPFLVESRDNGINLWPTTYPSGLPEYTYTYNTVYSQMAEYPQSFILNPIYDRSTKFDTEVKASEPANPGSLVDNWTIFKPANTLNVDSSYGPLHRLKSFNNKLYYFQDNAIGTIASNERSVIKDDEGAQLALGTGGILERHDIIITGVGIRDSLHVINGIINLFFIDMDRAQIIDVNNPYVSLGDVTKTASLIFNSILGVAGDVNKITLGYDPIYKEYLFTFGDQTLAYAEFKKFFTSRYSAAPTMYFNNNHSLFSFINYEDQGTERYIFEHNMGNIGDVYKEVLTRRNKYAYVTYLFNPNGIRLADINNISYKADIYDGKLSFPDAFPRNDRGLTEISIMNQYATTVTPITLKSVDGNPANTMNIAGEWRTQFRLTPDGNRMTAPYHLVSMRFDNTLNQLMSLHAVTVDYMEHKV